MMQGQLHIHKENGEVGSLSHTIHKTELKMDQIPKVKAKPIQLLEENIG